MDFNYTITKFDEENKIVVVTFAEGGWAEIRLSNPLPSTIEEFDRIVAMHTAPVEVVEARENPSSDLSFIAPLVNTERTAQRFSLVRNAIKAPASAPSPQDGLQLQIRQILLEEGLIQ